MSGLLSLASDGRSPSSSCLLPNEVRYLLNLQSRPLGALLQGGVDEAPDDKRISISRFYGRAYDILHVFVVAGEPRAGTDIRWQNHVLSSSPG